MKTIVPILALFFAFLKIVTAVSTEKEASGVLNLYLDYSFDQYPDLTKQDVAELRNGEEVSLTYTVVNLEEFDLAVVGVGGSFRDPNTGEDKVNLTSSALGPIFLKPQSTETFSQRIPLNVLDGNYILSPQVFAAVNDTIQVIPVKGQLTVITDVPISWFDPKLLFLEAILLGSFSVLVYVAYEAGGKKYLRGTAPVAKQNKKVPTAAAAESTGKSYDTNWIPEGHLKFKKGKKN